MVNKPLTNLPDLFPFSDKKALKYAFWNAVVITCLMSILALCIAVFLVFQVFLRPICWALIVGTCLFPCKLMLTRHLREYLHRNRENGNLFGLTVVLAPIHLARSSIARILATLWSKIIPLTAVLFSTGTFLFMQEFGLFLSLGHRLLRAYSTMSTFFASVSFVFPPLTVLIISALHFFITYTNCIQISPTQMSLLLLFMRFLVITAFSSLFGSLQPVIVVGLVFFVILGYFLPTGGNLNGEFFHFSLVNIGRVDV